MNLRPALAADAEPIAELHAASWRQTYGDALDPVYLEQTVPAERKAIWKQRFRSPRPGQYVVVAESGGEVVGFACAFGNEHPEWGSYLDNLHVARQMQGQGIGRALMRNVAQWCAGEAPGSGLYLSVNQGNRRAQQFYGRLGARNAKPGTWNAPDGSVVPTYWFVWDSVERLAAGTADALRDQAWPEQATGTAATSEQDRN